MCGIAGLNWSDRSLTEQMNKCLVHRGPDDAGIFVDEGVSLGHQRLAILDLSAAGHQPMEFADLVITYNGEIYNYLELKDELEKAGCKFKSQSDTEVILAAYHKWGKAAVAKFNGIFALAIWNKSSKELFLARDHLGIKPLYYHHNQGKFIFGSEIAALLKAGISRSVNIRALNFLLQVLYVPEPETMFAGIYKLAAGHYAVLKNGKLQMTKYWDVPNFTDSQKSFSELKIELRDLIKAAIQKQLVSDRPLGVFLSGGWDSSTILGVMRELGAMKIETFSSGFESDNPKYNQDFLLARETAKFYKTDHHEIVLPRTRILEILDRAVSQLGEPNAAPTILPLYYLSQLTKPQATVVLTGDGGDELFAGYPRYTQSFYLNKFQNWPKMIRGFLPYRIIERLSGKQDLRRKLGTAPGYARFAMFKVYPEEKIKKLMAKGFVEKLAESHFTKYLDNKNIDFEKSLMYLDLKNWLPAESLWKTDRMTAAHALEGRVPFLDPRLVELAFQIPSKYKIHNFSGKWIFKEAIKSYIPEHLRNKPKTGWLTPGGAWLRSDLKPLMESVLEDEYCPDLKNYFNLEYATSLYAEHLSGKGAHMNQLWAILTFAIWYNKYLK